MTKRLLLLLGLTLPLLACSKKTASAPGVDVELGMPIDSFRAILQKAGYPIRELSSVNKDVRRQRFRIPHFRLPGIEDEGNARFLFEDRKLSSFGWDCGVPEVDSNKRIHPAT